ncbi:hypothetical protein DYB25_000793 [Aphanomyces astaci]|uniref:EamA domain-containing protein n=1 Tax=Aphanomyces astaci TaxID=112090 RepID=A0A397BD66_APHAT|nr:hypothetical protein DYB25_000793 [Aphanomyces astaci]
MRAPLGTCPVATMSCYGVLAAVLAYSIWGLSALYWSLLAHVKPEQLVSHRIVWCFVIVLSIVAATQWKSFRSYALLWPNIRLHAVAATLLATNWWLFVWSVHAGYVVQACLGGYILPLVTVLLGVVVMGERLRKWQIVAICLAGIGVLVISIGFGVIPWLSFALALTDGAYGLIKKKSTVASIEGVVIETGTLVLPAVGYLVFAEVQGVGAYGHGTVFTNVLLMGGGVLATTSLISFAYAVHHMPLTLVGVLRYITPTIQVFLAVYVYREPFTPVNIVGFVLLWAALILFTSQSYFKHQEQLKEEAHSSLLAIASMEEAVVHKAT